jgi:hypothetical protein
MNSAEPFSRVINDATSPEQIAASLDHISYQLMVLSIRQGEADEPNLLQHLDTLRLMRNAALQSGKCILKPLDAA